MEHRFCTGKMDSLQELKEEEIMKRPQDHASRSRVMSNIHGAQTITGALYRTLLMRLS